MVDRKGIVVCNGIKERKTDDDKRIRDSSSLKDTYKISFSFSGLHKRPGLSKEREVFHLPDSRLSLLAMHKEKKKGADCKTEDRKSY